MNKPILIIAAVIVVIIAIGVIYITIGEGVREEQLVVTLSDAPEEPVVQTEQRQISFISPAVVALPQEIRDWVKNSLKLDLTRFANAREFDGKQYLFIASGRRGFVVNHLVEITDVSVVREEEVMVKAKFTRLPPEQPTIQATDNPYDLVYIESTGLPIRFVAIGDDKYFPITVLGGIDHLPTIVSQSREIKVFTPAPNEVVGHKFSVSGVANVFEATVIYRLLDAEQNRLVHGFTGAVLAPNFTREPVIPGSAINWRYFTFDLTVPEIVPSGANLILELYWESPKDGSEVGLVVMPLKMESRR